MNRRQVLLERVGHSDHDTRQAVQRFTNDSSWESLGRFVYESDDCLGISSIDIVNHGVK